MPFMAGTVLSFRSLRTLCATIVSTPEVQELSDAWLINYNEHRPHDALGRVSPLTYLARVTPRSESNYEWST